MTQQINLFNPLFRKKSFSLMSAAGMLLAFAFALATAVLLAVYQERQAREVEVKAQGIEQAYKAVSAANETLAAELAKQKPNAQLEAEIAALETQLGDRQEIVAFLKSGAVGTTEGFADFMRAFSRQSVSGLWLTGFDIAQSGNALALQGRTLNAELVASYLKRLNQEKTMQGRQFAAMRINQPPPQPPVAANPVERKDGKADKDQKPSPPRYLEFMISTLDIPDGPRPAENPVTVTSPLLGPLSAATGADAAQGAAKQADAR